MSQVQMRVGTTPELPIRCMYTGDEGHDAYLCTVDNLDALVETGTLDAKQVPELLAALAAGESYIDETPGYIAFFDTDDSETIAEAIKQRAEVS